MTYLHQIMLADNAESFDKTELYEKKTNTILKYTNTELWMWYPNDIEKLINDNFDSNVLTAYKKIRSAALKADIARYCIMYIYGGWYADLLMSLTKEIPYNVNDYEMVLFKDMASYSKIPLAISTSLFMVREPGHQAIKNALDRSVKNIMMSRYPREVHLISSPCAFGLGIGKYLNDNPGSKMLCGNLSFLNSNIKNAEFFITDISSNSTTAIGHSKYFYDNIPLPQNYQPIGTYNELFASRSLYEESL